MTRVVSVLAGVAVVSVLVPGAPALAQDLQQKLAAAKGAAAANQQALRAYSWVETSELSFKGAVKNTTVSLCRYGADGAVQKTPLVQPPPAEKKRGLRGRIVENKKEEMKEELQAAVALVHRYLPPAPDLMQAVMSAGTASLAQAGPGRAALRFPGYVKAKDALLLTFDTDIKALRQVDVETWLDEPENGVTLAVTMGALPDGTSHPSVVVLGMPNRQIAVKITNTNYQRLAQ